jgi:hypothetical protein
VPSKPEKKYNYGSFTELGGHLIATFLSPALSSKDMSNGLSIEEFHLLKNPQLSISSFPVLSGTELALLTIPKL